MHGIWITTEIIDVVKPVHMGITAGIFQALQCLCHDFAVSIFRKFGIF